jgi:hypothetical protein
MGQRDYLSNCWLGTGRLLAGSIRTSIGMLFPWDLRRLLSCNVTFQRNQSINMMAIPKGINNK